MPYLQNVPYTAYPQQEISGQETMYAGEEYQNGIKVCMNCGAKNDAQNKFCFRCGQQI